MKSATAMKIIETATGKEYVFNTLDQALRNLKDSSGNPLLTKVGRKTFSQGNELLERNGYKIKSAPSYAPAAFKNGGIPAPTQYEKHEYSPTFKFPWEDMKWKVSETAQTQPLPMPEKIKLEPLPAPKEEFSKTEQGNPVGELAKLLGQMVDVEQRTKKVVAEEAKTIDAAVKLNLEMFKSEIVEIVKNFRPMTTEVIVKLPEGGAKEMGVQHKNFPILLNVLSQRVNCLMVGQAGSGKTMGAEKAAEALGLKYYTISVGAQTTKTEFFGYMDATGKYVRTLFREAFEFGGVFLLDEMDAGNANVIVSINQALANGVTAFPDGMVAKHPDFILVATANTWGNGTNREYVGRNQLDASTLDRFAMIEWSYDEELEDALTSNKKWLKEVRRIRNIVAEKKIRQVISPRASITGSKLLAAGMDWDTVKEMLILKSMNESERVLCK